MKKILAFSILLGLLVTASPVGAVVNVNKVSLPATAVEVAPNVFSLGVATDPTTGRQVEGYAIIHRREPAARGGNAINGRSGRTACYGFLADGAKWKGLESWLVNATNVDGLSDSTVFDTVNNGVTKWETASGRNILGVGSSTSAILEVDNVAPDGNNELYFGAIADSGVIGVTTVWGYFSGRPASRELLEWDMVLNDVDYAWSASGEANKMDLDNIVTHELGHAVGLGDLYDSTCAEETMYGYATYGETKKQTLNAGDIAGISKLYK
ncbi:MAG: matrixin family metalloprotease [bacterium]|nr:matrixin family metalloprotease [bacterium]